MPPWDEHANAIFLKVVACTETENRERAIRDACGEDDELRMRVTRLLHAHESSGGFLRDPLPTRTDHLLDGGEPAESIPGCFQPDVWFAENFQIRRVLGCGGMGLVALAQQQLPLERLVAIKILRSDSPHPGLWRRFELERAALAAMNHPGIASVWEAGYVNARNGLVVEPTFTPGDTGKSPGAEIVPYLVMEYIEGIAIDQFCRAERPDRRMLLKLVISACQALEHAHQKGVVHRDVKPSNVLVCRAGAEWTCKVIDFGLAMSVGKSLKRQDRSTVEGSLLGTVDFMSPEQLSDAEVDTRTDIFSMGVLLYLLLTGALPHASLDGSGVDFWTAAHRIRTEPARRPSWRIAATGAPAQPIPAELDWIVLKALAKDPSDRYPTATALAEDLRRLLNQQPVSAHPPSLQYVWWKAFQRHRTVVLVAMAGMLMLILGILGTSWGLWRATEQARRARQGETQVQTLLVDSYRAAAAGAIRRGQWQEALNAIESALRLDGSQGKSMGRHAADFRLLQIDALHGIGDVPAWRSRIDELAEREDQLTEPQLAQLRLWQAEVALLDNDESIHQQRLAESVKRGLASADEHYARALDAPSTPESIDHLKSALKASPFHYRATRMLPVLLCTLGRFEEAQGHITVGLRLFPQDPVFIITAGCAACLQGDRTRAETLLQSNGKSLDTNQVAQARLLFDTLDQLRESMDRAILNTQASGFAADLSFAHSGDLLHQMMITWRLQIPFSCRRHLQQCVDAIGMSFYTRDYSSSLAALDSAVAVHPDGLLYYLQGTLNSFQGQWEPAIAAFEQAQTVPSCFSSVEPAAIYALVMSRCAVYLQDPPTAMQRQELSQLIQRRVAMAEMLPARQGQLAVAAILADDLDLADRMIQIARYRDPQAPQLLVFEARIHLARGRDDAALRAADAALKKLRDPRSLFGLLPGQQVLIEKAESIREQILGPDRPDAKDH